MIARFKAHWPFIVILALNVALSVAFSLVNPLYESTDELHNYRYIRYVLATGKLPVLELDPHWPRIQAHHPPLYYLLGAAATFWIPQDTPWSYEPVWNPHRGFHSWEVGADNKNYYLHSPHEWSLTPGASLAARVARWVNGVLGGLMVVVTYAIARRTFRDRKALALGAAAIVAFNPQFLYLSGAVNNDIAAGLAGSALVLATIDQAGRPLTLRRAAWLGLLFGLALNSKFNLVFMLGVVELGLGIAVWRERASGGWRKWLVANLVLLATALALSGWWFARNQALYGDPTAIRRTNELWGGRDLSASWSTAMIELPYAWSSLWGRFGYGQIPMPPGIYTAILCVAIAAAIGLAFMLARRLAEASSRARTPGLRGLAALLLNRLPRRPAAGSGTILVLLAAVGISACVLFGYMLISTAGPMGRFFFPALAALAVLMMLGLSQLVPERYHAILAAWVTVSMLGLAVYALFGVLAPAFARPALLTPEQAAAIPHPLDVTFEGKARLLGYHVDVAEVRPGGQLAVTLYWQALAEMSENYAVFVHLLNSAGALSAQRDTFPGLGNFPTSQWKPGDTFADTYRMDIGETAYAPDEALVRVGLYRPSGPRLNATTADGRSLGDGVTLSAVRLVPRPGPFPNAARVNFGGKMALVGYDVDSRVVRAGETVSVTLVWQSLAPMDVDYRVFAHLTGANGDIVAMNDGLPNTSPKRTRRWLPGQVFLEVRTLTVAADALPGLYDIDMGVYVTRGRLPIVAPDGHYISEQMTLVQVRVGDN